MMIQHSRQIVFRHSRWLAIAGTVLACSLGSGQQPNVHYFHRADMPPGVVGQQQLWRSPGLAGYSQAVEVLVPARVHVSFMIDGAFEPPRPGPVMAGMHVGHVYQLKITNIPFFEGAELYPTVELVNRLNPPEGSKTRYPVPIELTREEMEMALDGRYVTRVIYLEDPTNALPQRDDPRHQRVVEAGPQEDPLYVADRLGRPLAILRMGSRVPESGEMSGVPGLGSPPIELYEAPDPRNVRDEPTRTVDRAVDRQRQAVPRVSMEPSFRRAGPSFPNRYSR